MKPKTIKFILVFFNLVMLSSLGWSQCDGCNSNTTGYWTTGWDYVNCTEWVTSMDDCNQGDLDVLQNFIDNSQWGENPPPSDLSPIELQVQYWENGRLIFIRPDWDNWENMYFLYGEIPSEIGNLTSLTQLDLSYNQLTDIPSEIENLTNLTGLYLYGNQLTDIPSEIGNLTSLTQLDLSYNQLTDIPSEIGNLTSLTQLDLSYNQLTDIPSEIGNLTNLNYLYLSSNQLTGEIPSWIGNITNINLSSNQLTGVIPIEICNQEDSSPSLSNNQLCPPYPECLNPDDVGIQNLDNCNEIIIECENGYIDKEYFCYSESDLDFLQEIINNSSETISYNMDDDTNGVIEPLELGGQSWVNGRLISLSCYNGMLSGEIPSSIGNLTKLTSLILQKNDLSGSIPKEIGNLQNVTDLWLSQNQLSGEIPKEIGNMDSLRTLYLWSNQLSGEIPSEIGQLSELIHIDFNMNNLSGNIPSEIGQLSKLIDLLLSHNQLSGEIPSEIGGLVNLRKLWLNYNQLTGSIPSEISSLVNLKWLWLQNNLLTGEIPSEIGNLINLISLKLNNNQFTGEITPSIGNLTNLHYLYLDNNQFSGSIPVEICDLNINWGGYDDSPNGGYRYFRLSNNNLCPPYPECIEEYIGEQDTTGCPPLSITDNLIPTTYNLSSPYPNPFNPTTSISLSIPQSDIVSLNVYDITGKLVTTLINKQLNIGYHSIDWDGTKQSSGMYFVRMESGEYVETQKLLLVK